MVLIGGTAHLKWEQHTKCFKLCAMQLYAVQKIGFAFMLEILSGHAICKTDELTYSRGLI